MVPASLEIRAFICVDLPAAVRRRAEELQRRLATCGADVNWVRKENLHLTLRFLGEISRHQLESACAGTKRAAAGVEAFQLRFSGSGCFPSERHPKVVWVGLAEIPQAILNLHVGIEQELVQAGFPCEERPFSPHLTLGRVRSSRNSSRLVERLSATEFNSETFLVREVVVMKSELKSSGAVYTPIERVELKQQRFD